eukprot:c16178_g1_i1 orf=79-1485(+)
MELSPLKGKTANASSSSATGGGGLGGGARQAWWEAITRARERIYALKEILGPLSSLEALDESERPARGLLEDEHVAHAILTHLMNPSSGHGQDALCQWLYDTYQTGDPDLQAVVFRYIPALCGLYLSRIISHNDESLAGFEAVLLALYGAEVRARNGCAIMVNIPDLSQPSLYHAPRVPCASPAELRLGQLSAPLEPQETIKATKRACVVGVALELFCRKIAIMPQKAKIEACQCALRLARLSCSHEEILDDMPDDSSTSSISGHTEKILDSNHQLGTTLPSGHMPEIEIVGPGELFLGNKSPSHHNSALNHVCQTMVSEVNFSPKRSPSMKHTSSDLPVAGKQSHSLPSSKIADASVDFVSSLMQAGNGARLPLSWELVQPLIRILGHCLLAPSKDSEELKVAASAAVKTLHRRACHDLMPEAMLATRSLMRLETASKVLTKTHSASGNSTSGSSKPRKPEILLVSK